MRFHRLGALGLISSGFAGLALLCHAFGEELPRPAAKIAPALLEKKSGYDRRLKEAGEKIEKLRVRLQQDRAFHPEFVDEDSRQLRAAQEELGRLEVERTGFLQTAGFIPKEVTPSPRLYTLEEYNALQAKEQGTSARTEPVQVPVPVPAPAEGESKPETTANP